MWLYVQGSCNDTNLPNSKTFWEEAYLYRVFAKVTSPTLSGKYLYRFADQFYVQWESMKKIYPNSIYVGGIY